MYPTFNFLHDRRHAIKEDYENYQVSGKVIKIIYHGQSFQGLYFMCLIFGPPSCPRITGEERKDKAELVEGETNLLQRELLVKRTNYVGYLGNITGDFEVDIIGELREGAQIGIQRLTFYYEYESTGGGYETQGQLAGMEIVYWRKHWHKEKELLIKTYASHQVLKDAKRDFDPKDIPSKLDFITQTNQVLTLTMELNKFEVIIEVSGIVTKDSITHLVVRTNQARKLLIGDTRAREEGYGVNFQLDNHGTEIIVLSCCLSSNIISRLFAYYYDC